MSHDGNLQPAKNRRARRGQERAWRRDDSALSRLDRVTPGDKRGTVTRAYDAFRRGLITKRQAVRLGVLGSVLYRVGAAWLALTLAAPACTTAGGNTRVNWPAVASCAPSTSDVVGSVSRILLTDGTADERSISERAVGELEGLARTHTPQLVACLVDELVRGWSRPGAAAHPARVAATARGQDFLRRVAGTSVIRREVEL